jgi:hypothetical protein
LFERSFSERDEVSHLVVDVNQFSISSLKFGEYLSLVRLLLVLILPLNRVDGMVVKFSYALHLSGDYLYSAQVFLILKVDGFAENRVRLVSDVDHDYLLTVLIDAVLSNSHKARFTSLLVVCPLRMVLIFRVVCTHRRVLSRLRLTLELEQY